MKTKTLYKRQITYNDKVIWESEWGCGKEKTPWELLEEKYGKNLMNRVTISFLIKKDNN
jgi:hypothetical protein